MNRLESQPSHISSTYAAQIAKIYKEFKKPICKNISKKLQVFINESGSIELKDEKEAKLQGFKKLDRKSLYKQIKSEIDKNSVDQKTARRAVKALLLLPWKKPFDVKKVTTDFPILQSSTSHKAEALLKMIDRLDAIARSEEGGTGVIFVDCPFVEGIKDSYAGQITIKFVKEARTVIVADRLLRALGFTTPRSFCLNTDTPLKAKLIALTHSNLSSIDASHHEQIKKQTGTAPCMLIMTTMMNVMSFRHVEPEIVLAMMDTKDILRQIGRMILFDAFMNNTDRLNSDCCNLGNFMIDDQNHLMLLDHEFNLNSNNVNEVKNRLLELLKGKQTDKILENLAGAFKHDRKKVGGVTLSPELLKSMKPYIEEGMQQAGRDLTELFSNPMAFTSIFQPYKTEMEGFNFDLIVELIKALK